MRGQDELRADLFCSFLMSRRILTGMQIRNLVEKLKIGSLADLYANRNDIFTTENLNSDQYARWKKFLASQANLQFDEYIRYVSGKGIYSTDYLDPEYPSCLDNLPNMPIILYLKGDAGLLSKKYSRVCMVGTRRPSTYGRRVTKEFSRCLTMHDVVIVSGLARGIDGISHQTCLEHGGRTVAVLPCGLDIIYPPDHTDLFHEIAEKGLLVSELLPGTPATRQYFPARNRILSALSDCVLIPEAGENSGTLHTASFAAAQSKEVFVVPHIIYTDTGKGNLGLIKDGAQVATDPEDVLAFLAGVVFFREIDEIKDEFRMHALREKIKNDPLSLESSEVRMLICEVLASLELSSEEISNETALPYSIVMKELGKMEIEGIVTKELQKYILTIR